MALPLWGGAASAVLLSDPPLLAPGRTVVDEIAAESPYGEGFADQLRAAAGRAVERGFAVTHGERELGASGVSAPVRRGDGRVVAAVGVGGPTTRFSEERLPAYVDAVRRCARMISPAAGVVSVPQPEVSVPDVSQPDADLLAGVKVLDLTNVLAGPFAGYQLALMGADVIKIEAPAIGDLARNLGADPG